MCDYVTEKHENKPTHFCIFFGQEVSKTEASMSPSTTQLLWYSQWLELTEHTASCVNDMANYVTQVWVDSLH